MSAETVPAETSGIIHDLGYQRYAGERGGRGAIVRTLIGYSLRSAFGLGRGARAKVVPVGVFAAMCLPAVINAFVVARGGSRAFPYDTYSYPLRVVLITLFVAAQAPELASFSGRRAFAAGGVAGFFFLTWVLSEVLGPLAPRAAGLVCPFTLLDGVRQELGGTSPGPLPAPGGWGAADALLLLALVAASVAALVTRYREAA